MQVRVLGDLEVAVGGQPLELGGPKPRTLLALLVAGEGRPVSVEHLIDQIWGEDPPVRVEASLQSYVARLRRVMEPARQARGRATVLRSHPGGYSLDLPPGAVDARRFAQLLREARATLERDTVAAERLLVSALGLWRGAAYSGMTGSALAAASVGLEELRATALEDLWGLRVRRGRDPEAVATLEQLVALHPLRERLWGLLARALCREDRQGDALAVLRRAREHLAEELGIDPGPELRNLEELVLRQDAALYLPPVEEPVPPLTPVTARTRTTTPALPEDAGSEPLFGRAEVLEVLGGVLREAAEHRHGRLVLVTGEPGIGKTALLREVHRRAGRAGLRRGRGTWDTEGVPALWGWTRAVEEALGSAEALTVPGAEDVDAASAGFRRADALLAAVREGPATLLVLDDVHWADADSLRLLRRLAAEARSVPLVLVVSLRSSEADHGPAVTATLAALARVDAVRVELGGLDPDAVTGWVEERAGVRVPQDVARTLVDRSAGNPLYLGELVRSLVRDGALTSLSAPAWTTVPDNVRDLVRHRTSDLPPEHAAVLGTAAVAGRSFDLLVVERASGADATTVDAAVESALMLGLVEVEGAGSYRFTHALVRDALYDMVPAPTRARTHGAVAAALESRYAGSVGAHVAELAEHYRLAGPVLARSAWLFASRAAHAAAGQSAHDESLRLHVLAASLQAGDPAVTPVEHERELLGQATALVRLGHPLQAWPKVAAAAESALRRGDVQAAADALLTVTVNNVWGWRETTVYDDDAIALWERVLDLLPLAEELTRAQLQGALASELLYKPGTAARATGLADAAVEVVRRNAPDRVRLHVLRLALQALQRPDLLTHRLELDDELVDLAEAVGDTSALSAGLTARASDLFEQGRLEQARADVSRAAELARRHRLPQNIVVTGWQQATLHQMDGDDAAAEAVIAQTESLDATLSMAGLGIAAYKRAVLRLGQGRLPELEQELAALSDRIPLFRDLHALSLVEAGRLDDARRALGAWRDQPPLPWDYLWLGFTVLRAQLWARLDDAEAVRDLRAALAPYESRVGAGALAVAFHGAVAMTLGQLAAAAGDEAAAREHLTRARQVHESLGLAPWVRRTDGLLAALGPGSPVRR
ncbi:MAG TPA: BTAD domain-containing putative transcriptional regulator [Candidatus Nanopelagicales bacterium]